MTLQLKMNGIYRDREGRRVRIIGSSGHKEWPWRGDNAFTYRDDGTQSMRGVESGVDLIAEWADEPVNRREDGEFGEGATIVSAPAKPVRVQILQEGAELTNGSRDVEYGTPAVNMAAAGELKAVFRKHLRRDISQAELEALDLALTKLGRIATGAQPKRDTYVDCATYIAIAGEIALSGVDSSS